MSLVLKLVPAMTAGRSGLRLACQSHTKSKTSMHTGHLQPALRTLDDYVAAFEHAWQGPLPPEITNFVPPENHAERKLIVLEMVRADLEFRWQRSLQKPLDQYTIEFPDLFDDEQNFRFWHLKNIEFGDFTRKLSVPTCTPRSIRSMCPVGRSLK